MSTPSGFRNRADDSLLSLLGDVPELVRNLVVAEVDSAKSWAKSTGKTAGLGGVFFIVALFFLFWAIPAAGAFAIIGLSSWMPAWLASLIVLLIGIVLAVVAAGLGVLKMRRLTHTKTPVAAIKTDAQMVKDIADEY